MKKLVTLMTAVILFTANNLHAQKPAFYTDKGATKILTGDLVALDQSNDLMVKIPITQKLYNFDRFQFVLVLPTEKGILGEKLNNNYFTGYYNLSQLKAQNNNELALWIFNPSNKTNCQQYEIYCGNFYQTSSGQAHYICPNSLLPTQGGFLHNKPRVKEGAISPIKLAVWAYTKTGNDYLGNPVYDNGMIILESDEFLLKDLGGKNQVASESSNNSSTAGNNSTSTTSTNNNSSNEQTPPKDGPYKEKDSDGNIRAKGQYNNGLKTGEWTIYSNGTIKALETYKDGNLHGACKYYSDGKLLQEGGYANGLKNGAWKSYNTDGTISVNQEYKDGVLAPASNTGNINSSVSKTTTDAPMDELSKIDTDPLGQWAEKAEASTSYSGYGAEQMKGKPNVASLSNSSASWCPASENTGNDWIKLTFSKPVFATEIRVRQNFTPGAITKVEVIDEKGASHVVWEGIDKKEYGNKIGYFITAFKKTTYKVNAVKVTLGSKTPVGWNEIDAVQLVGTDK